MADLSTYTPIYIRTTGSDATGDGSLAAPFATAQKGFQTAYLATGNHVLDLGTGSFGGVNLANANATGWPARIAVQGVSVALSNLGGIYGSYNPNLDYSGEEIPPGHPIPGTITIIGNNTANLGNVTTHYPQLYTGSVTLTDSTAGNITTLSNDSGYPSIELTNSTAGNLSATNDGGSSGYIYIKLDGSSAGDLYGSGSLVHLAFWGSFSFSRILSFSYIYIQINGVNLNGWLSGIYYITGIAGGTSATTLDANGNGEWDGDCYLNGQVNNDVKDCDGVCGGSTYWYDHCGNQCGGAQNECDCGWPWFDCGGTPCGSNNYDDCAGTPCGTAVVDCNGDCNGSAVVHCEGNCGGSAVVDYCGVCSGSPGYNEFASNECDCGLGVFDPCGMGCNVDTRDCNGECGVYAIDSCGNCTPIGQPPVTDECGTCSGPCYVTGFFTYDAPSGWWAGGCGCFAEGYYYNYQLTTLPESGTGWSSAEGYGTHYFIGGVITTLPQSGTGWWATAEKYYIGGVETSLPESGTGAWDNKCYVNGQEVVGTTPDCAGVCGGGAVVDCEGTCGGSAVVDDCGTCGGGFFISETTTQWVECLNKYYIGGVVTTLPQSGTGSWNNKYYIAGEEAQLDANGNGFLNGLFYVGGVLANGSVQFSNVPPSPPAWGNFTHYAQGAVVSDNGSLWLLVSTGGWTVGGRPGLGYGWQQLSTGGGGLPTPSVNLAQLLGLPPFVQL